MLAGILGQRIAAKTGKPVGIIFMQSAGGKEVAETELKYWIDEQSLAKVPSLAAKVSKPGKIDGRSIPLEISNWPLANPKEKDAAAAVNAQTQALIEKIVGEAYK